MPDQDQRAASAHFPENAGCLASAKPAMDFGPRGWLWIPCLAGVLAFLAFALCRNITVPWVEDDNWYGAVYSQAAHNSLRAGMRTTAGVPATLYFGALPIPADAYYVHHPTLLPTLVTASFAVFGESEWAARLVPIASSLASVVLLWLLVADALGFRAATLAAAIFATLPMELHYGDMVDFEPCLLMWMLAALACLRRWERSGRVRWAALAVTGCLFAVLMDWPGYLFAISLAAYFLLKWWRGVSLGAHITPRRSLWIALGILGAAGLAGVLFLVQIRWVRADAWTDLWTALTMRLSSSAATDGAAAAGSAAHFTLWQWCGAILGGLRADFLLPPWFLAAAGLFLLWKERGKSEGLRWCGFAMMPMITAGVLYVVILRNESFVHDFTTFYLIGALAIAAGIGLEGVLVWLEKKFRSRLLQTVAALAVIGAFTWLGMAALARSEDLRSPFYVLDAEQPEPPDFIPSLGRELARIFPAGTGILCNFAASGTLDYYAQRTVMNGLLTPADWAHFIAEEPPPLGGIVWLDAPHASEIIASLPPGEMSQMTFQGFRFALWKSQAR